MVKWHRQSEKDPEDSFSPILDSVSRRVYLPFQCNDYEIGGINEVDLMIEKLQKIREKMILSNSIKP
jgi:hypothetical protein